MQIIKVQLSFISLSLIILLLLTYNVSGETSKTIQAVKTDTPPVIDGILDDIVWQKAAKVSDFIQHEPEKGKKTTYPTTVYLLYDENRLYVGFECIQDMETCQASATRRDYEFFNDDHVEVFLDTFHDKRNCYSFAVNLLSTQSDRRIANEGANQMGGGGGGRGDRSWDCDWDGRAAKGEGKWTAEISIPFSELRFNKKSDAVWGINFWRSLECQDEEDSWVDLGNRRYAVSCFGELVGLPVEQLVTTRPVELKPYYVAAPKKSSDWDVDWKVSRGDKKYYPIGLDVRYPFSSITLDMTLNPDYAQIEADPGRINLSDVPERLPEKRPFFQEGSELFRTPMDIFYTRAIESPLLGLKLAGKVGNYNIAMLDSQEEGEEEPWPQNGSNNFFVFRVQRDIGERSTIGILGVNKQRLATDCCNLTTLGSLKSALLQDWGSLSTSNRVIGMDTNISLPKDIRLNGQYALTRSNDMKKNPDADAFMIEFGRRTSGLSFEGMYGDIGPDFEAEAGFVPDTRIDRRGGEFEIGYRKQYKRIFPRRIGCEARYMRLYNHAGERTNEQFRISTNIGIWDFWCEPELQWYPHRGIDEMADIEFTDKTVGFFGGFFPPKWVRLFTRGEIGKIEDRDTIFFGPELTVNPVEDLTLRADIQWLKQEWQEPTNAGWIQKNERTINRRFTIEYRFTQRMNLRASMETTRRNFETPDFPKNEEYVFVLYSWEFKPESNFYWVYTMNRVGDEHTEHIVFVKLAYLMKWNVF
jgi:hypothetical protein